jgi:uncharacterized membrane protein (DUF2068 family)
MGAGVWFGFPESFATNLTSLADATGFFWARALVAHAFAKLLALDGLHRHVIGLACVTYAGVFTVEGIGLVLRKHWAEWFTVIVTGSFVPLELYELGHRPGWGKVVALVLNVAIAAYLVVRIRRRRIHPWVR